ncbi:MAG TPA: adenosylcobinamide-GDP ribazoletransferase [Ruminiclostridium sp.]
MKNFILMLQFLTRIPINIKIAVDDKSFKNGMVYFPLVGLVIGVLNGIVFLLSSLVFSNLIVIILVTLFNVCITGAFHLDGLADTCDGIYSSRSKERILEIMKDSRIGTNGGVAIFFDLALRMALLNSISNTNYNIVKAIIIASVLSRTILVMLSYISVYARKENGLGNLFIGKISIKTISISLIMGTLIIVLILGFKGLFIILPILIIMFLYEKYIKSKIDGMTGDTLGAGCEITEILVLCIFIVLQKVMLL